MKSGARCGENSKEDECCSAKCLSHGGGGGNDKMDNGNGCKSNETGCIVLTADIEDSHDVLWNKK